MISRGYGCLRFSRKSRKEAMRHTILLLLSAFFLFHPLEGEAGRKEARDKAREKKRVAELVKRLKKGERIPGGADLREAKLSRVNLRGADLFRAKLYGAELYGVELYGADLREAKLSRVNLRGADLSRAYLERAKLSGADLERAVLSKAYLRGATYDDKTVFPAGFDPKSAGMVKAGVKKESADKKLSIQGCEGGEMSPDEKIITCPNGHIYQRADSPVLDILRSHGKEQIVPLLPLGQEDDGGGAIGQ